VGPPSFQPSTVDRGFSLPPTAVYCRRVLDRAHPRDPAEATDEVTARLALRGTIFEVRDGETLARATPGRAEVRIYVTPERAAEEQAASSAWCGEWRNWSRRPRSSASRRPRSSTRPGATPGSVSSGHSGWGGASCCAPAGTRCRRTGRPRDRPRPGARLRHRGPASTRLCLDALERLEAEGLRPARFLDAGCGSGILAIAALRVWPTARGVCRDVDPEAVETARENAARNAVLEALDFVVGDAAAAGARFDLVLANIQLECWSASRALAAAVARAGAGALGLLDGQASPPAAPTSRHGLAVTGTLVAGNPTGCARRVPSRRGWEPPLGFQVSGSPGGAACPQEA